MELPVDNPDGEKRVHKPVILGRNGAGKSTLLQVLSGMLEPRSGVVTLDNVSMGHIDTADVRRDIGLISQNSGLFHGLYYCRELSYVILILFY